MSLAAATGEDGPVLQVKDVEVRVGARLLLNPVSFQVATGDKVGLVAVSYTHLTLPTICSV